MLRYLLVHFYRLGYKTYRLYHKQCKLKLCEVSLIGKDENKILAKMGCIFMADGKYTAFWSNNKLPVKLNVGDLIY